MTEPVSSEPVLTAPTGVLPNAVIRDPRSTGIFLFLQLDLTLTADGVSAWLKELTAYLRSLNEPGSNGPDFTAVVGFGPSFFGTAASPRFGLAGKLPAGFANPPTLPAQFPFTPDLLIYALSPREELLVQLVQQVSSNSPTPVSQVRVERGFQRATGRENFRFLDGLRNPGVGDRKSIAVVGLDQIGDEPGWVLGSAYLSYMKIRQDLAHAAELGEDAMEQAIGRRQEDGSRLDQPPGVAAKDEPDFTDPNSPAPGSHVRKVGPRGDEQGTDVAIVRRGLPYMDVTPTGQVEFGLHFVAFGDLDRFNTILNRWMLNPVFPAANTGADQLMTDNLLAFELGAFFIVPPDDDRFIGACVFDPEPAPTPFTAGRVLVKKRAVDANGNPLPQRSLRGAVFQVSQNGNPVGPQFTTDAAGHALSGDLPGSGQYLLREVTPLTGAAPAPDQPFTLTKQRVTLVVNNVFGQQPPGYSG
jgi:Dyp-type peroxidase family